MSQTMLWIAFNIFVIFLLMLDLGVFHKNNRVISVKESLIWSGIWIAVALVFNVGVYALMGHARGLEFLTVYIVERSLSVDNVFVFLLIFNYFRIPAQYQYKVLFWGILGALVMRAIFIVAGVALIQSFHWLIYVFGGLLVYIGVKLAFEKEKEMHPEKNPVLKAAKKFFPVAGELYGGNFTCRIDGKWYLTPLFLVLLVIETSDVLFAVDSIPAALAISSSSFVIYSANVFAILGLRALYFALAGCMEMFRYLNYGLAVILSFVGVKMLVVDIYHIPIGWSLGIIALILTVSVVLSLKKPVAPAGKPE